LYVRAIVALLATHRGDLVTARLNEVHVAGGNDLGIDAALAVAQSKAAGREKW
jgi:hypothetical protein